jgi:hypothetical protein
MQIQRGTGRRGLDVALTLFPRFSPVLRLLLQARYLGIDNGLR